MWKAALAKLSQLCFLKGSQEFIRKYPEASNDIMGVVGVIIVIAIIAAIVYSIYAAHEQREAIAYRQLDLLKRLNKKKQSEQRKQTEQDNNAVSDTDSPLHIAVQNQDIDIIKMLLDSGCNVNAKNAIGHTPLHLAVQSGNKEIVALLAQRSVSQGVDDGVDDGVGAYGRNSKIKYV